MSQPDLAAISAASIAKGSKSFAAASRLFDRETRSSVVMLYAWCRHCDDVVDGQEAGSAARHLDERPAHERIAALRADTEAAFEGRTQGLHPAFAALAEVVRRHAIPRTDAAEHLAGFAMDVDEERYRTLDDLLVYCWRVAGVVGVMMARIMGVRDEAVLDRASDLGLAFQLTNIARDVVDDAVAGRVYLPLDWLTQEGLAIADLTDPRRAEAVFRLRRRLVEAAEPYYASARIGVGALPRRSAWAVGTAHGIYRRIGLKLVAIGPQLLPERVSTTTGEKIAEIGRGAAMALRGGAGPARPPLLWTRPR
ncbi:phytoene/squalene synthase family protein [Aureimonas sp. Leaf324]|jgi:phytoene synthase|uniref:phytoene/squalene synthase family protein n=1 Tax=Aureimonas sp. Leaf324 TaxID=1736336 RepID=UPI0006FA5640|nr:phytoene/squalene synthase family protein [Aureimonas sp. Leaf324]KQQ81190.1 phytoene synthase [Aureimonas sp. Leaf324]